MVEVAFEKLRRVELNKKRETELAHPKSELEELNIAHESTLAALRMEHNNTLARLFMLPSTGYLDL